MMGEGHVGRKWHRQRMQCITNCDSKPSYLVCKVSSESSAQNTILVIAKWPEMAVTFVLRLGFFHIICCLQLFFEVELLVD